MTMLYKWTGGSVCGSEHVRIGKNNQDAWHVMSSNNECVAVVCDGCSGSQYSEVGAFLTSRIYTRRLYECCTGLGSDDIEVLRAQIQRAHRLALADIFAIVQTTAPGESDKCITDAFLCTVLACVATPEVVLIAGLGDGVYMLNGVITEIRSTVENMPEYPAYSLLSKETIVSQRRDALCIHTCMPAKEVVGCAIATDGFNGNDVLLAEFGNDARYVESPFRIGRKLAAVNQRSLRVDWDVQQTSFSTPLFADDATVVVIKQRKEKQHECICEG